MGAAISVSGRPLGRRSAERPAPRSAVRCTGLRLQGLDSLFGGTLGAAFDGAQPEDTDPAAAHGDHPPIKGKLPAGLRIGRPDAGFGAQQGFFAGRLHIEIGRHFGEVSAVEGLELPGIRHAGRLFTSRQFPELTDQAEDDFIIGLFQGNETTLVEVIQEWLLFGLNPSGFSGLVGTRGGVISP